MLTLVASLFTFSAAAANAEDETHYVRFTATGNDPYATLKFSSEGKNAEIDPDTVTWATIRYRVNNPVDSTGVNYRGQFYVINPAEPFVPITWDVSEGWHTIVVDCTAVAESTTLTSIWESSSYIGTSQIRFDPLEPDRDAENTADTSGGEVNKGDSIDIAYIAFFEKEDDAKAYTGKEDTPYCILDVASMLKFVASNNIKADEYTESGKVETGELEEIVVNPRGASATPVQLNGRVLGIHTPVVPDGFVLHDFILAACPTWNETVDCDCLAEVYRWRGDYDETLEYDPIASYEVLDHGDNGPAKFIFDKALRYGYSYLIMISPSNTGAFGYWTGEEIEEEGWEIWLDDIEEETLVPPISYTLMATEELPDFPADPTKAPTAEPTEAPEVTEAPATEEPAATDAPAEPTKAPEKDKEAKTDKKDSNVLPIVIGAVAAAIVIAAVIILVVKKKKK